LEAQDVLVRFFSGKTEREIVQRYGLNFYRSNYALLQDWSPLVNFISQIEGFIRNKGGFLLDVGSGYGLHSMVLTTLGYKVVSLDISTKTVKVHQALISDYSRGIPCYPIVADATRLPFGTNSIDVVYANEFISHVPDLSASIKEIGRVLRTGGELIISEVDRQSLLALRISSLRESMDREFFESRKKMIQEILMEKSDSLSENQLDHLASETEGLVRQELEGVVGEFLSGHDVRSMIDEFTRREPFGRKFTHRSPYGQYDERLFTTIELIRLLRNGFTGFRFSVFFPRRFSLLSNQVISPHVLRSIASNSLIAELAKIVVGKYAIYCVRK